MLGDGVNGNLVSRTIHSGASTNVSWVDKPSKIEVIVSNLYEEKIKLKYIYDVSSRDLTVENL